MSPQPGDAEVEAALDSVLDDPKAVFRLRLLRATRRLIAEQGLDVSIDLIADAVGVNRRTLFRHIESRDLLIAAALSSAMDFYDQQVKAIVSPDLPLHDWIENLARRMMEITIAAGAGYWQVAATPDDDLPAELAAINKRRRADRASLIGVTAQAIWERGGGQGPCPPVIIDAVGVSISTFATRSMIHDLGRDVPTVADHVATMLTTLVEAEAAKSRLAPPRKASAATTTKHTGSTARRRTP